MSDDSWRSRSTSGRSPESARRVGHPAVTVELPEQLIACNLSGRPRARSVHGQRLQPRRRGQTLQALRRIRPSILRMWRSRRPVWPGPVGRCAWRCVRRLRPAIRRSGCAKLAESTLVDAVHDREPQPSRAQDGRRDRHRGSRRAGDEWWFDVAGRMRRAAVVCCGWRPCGARSSGGHRSAARGSIPLVLLTSHFPDRHRRRHRAARRGTRDVLRRDRALRAGAKARLVAYGRGGRRDRAGVGFWRD